MLHNQLNPFSARFWYLPVWQMLGDTLYVVTSLFFIPLAKAKGYGCVLIVFFSIPTAKAVGYEILKLITYHATLSPLLHFL